MDRKVEFSMLEIVKIVQCLRDEQGSLGWLIRSKLADGMGRPFTKEEVYAAVDTLYQSHGDPCIQDSLRKYASNHVEIAAIWEYVAHLERPIAELLSLWDEQGNRRDSALAERPGPTWHVTPEEYR